MKPVVHVTTLRALTTRRNELTAHLSPAEIYFAGRFSDRARRTAWTLRRGYLRELLARELCLEPSAIRFEMGRHGKPHLEGHSSIGFNASSSGNHVAVAIGHEMNAGIDIEEVRPFPQWRDVAKLVLSPVEHSRLRALSSTEQTRGFWRAWTKHEAAIKLSGTGLEARLPGADTHHTHAESHADFELAIAFSTIRRVRYALSDCSSSRSCKRATSRRSVSTVSSRV